MGEALSLPLSCCVCDVEEEVFSCEDDPGAGESLSLLCAEEESSGDSRSPAGVRGDTGETGNTDETGDTGMRSLGTSASSSIGAGWRDLPAFASTLAMDAMDMCLWC